MRPWSARLWARALEFAGSHEALMGLTEEALGACLLKRDAARVMRMREVVRPAVESAPPAPARPPWEVPEVI